jgi:hypothetical protein
MLNETQSSAQPPYVYLSIHTEVLNLNLDQNLEIDILGLEDIQSFLNAHFQPVMVFWIRATIRPVTSRL